MGDNVYRPPTDMVQGAPDLLDFRQNQLFVGNIYRVIKSTESYYEQFVQDHSGQYSDGSEVIHTDIQSALDACVECRNDYVIVQPSNSDYDLTAALTLSKKSVHLICPAGMGLDRGATNACRIHQTTAATDIFTVSDASIEISGFYLKPYSNVTAIGISALGYSPNIHHNTIAMTCSSTTSEPMIHAEGDGGAYGDIHHNWIFSSAGDDYTIASIVTIGASATMAKCNYNEITIGDGATATVGITNAATKGMVAYNMFGGAGSDCTWTHCIALGSYGNAIGNRAVVADSIIVTGGSGTSTTYSDNMNGVDGGLIDDAT